MLKGFLPANAIVMARTARPAQPLSVVPAPTAQLVFVSEITGDQDDKAAQLLDKMIEAMGVPRDQVLITTDWRSIPCARVVVTLGELATQNLLQTQRPISELRGNFFEYQGARLMPTLHPAHLLRHPESKRETWSDLQKVAAELGIEIPKRR